MDHAKVIGCCLKTVTGTFHTFEPLSKEKEVLKWSKVLKQQSHRLVSSTLINEEAARQLDIALRSVEIWKEQYQSRHDRAAYRCYSRALIRAISEIGFAIQVLDLKGMTKTHLDLIEELEQLDKEFIR